LKYNCDVKSHITIFYSKDYIRGIKNYKLIKIALYRDAILLSAESEEKEKAQKMVSELEKLIAKL